MDKEPTLVQNPYISIIVPALNESGSLRELVERLHFSLIEKEISYEIILIDDRSTDATKDIAEQLAQEYPIRYFVKIGLQGKAESINEGMTHAKGEIFSFIDADLQYPPEKIPEMIEELYSGYDVVIGERQEQEVSILRRIASETFKFIFIKKLHGLTFDVQSGLKVFRKKCLEGVTLTSTKWSFDLEFLLKVRERGARITGVSIFFAQRDSGESKISLLSASYEIGKNAVYMKFKHKHPEVLNLTTDGSKIGAGFIHRGKVFTSHTFLPATRSALITFTRKQKAVIAGAISVIGMSLFVSPVNTVIGILGVLSAIYFIDTLFNLFLVYKSIRYNPELSFTNDQLADVRDEELPIYSILCPLFREKDVLPYFLNAIDNLDYPKEKLDVLLLLEAEDLETQEAAAAINMPPYVRTIIVPDSKPKTKPKACNYGLAYTKGENIVIYDAEDIPETTQLKKAYLGFKATPDNVVCLQAKLNYFNPKQNILTRLFTAEYSLWFGVLLPGMQSLNTFIPLGGTSNHFKAEVLKKLQGWDPFNVTEDCDLGVRLFSQHYRTAIIDSITFEEANSRLGNWIRQRSRWIKGYMQTYLVYMRNPITFFRTHGIHAFLFQLVVGFKVIFGLINPFLWGTTIIYFTARAVVGPAIESVYPAPIFIIAVISGIFGNFLFLYYYMIGCVKLNHWSITKYVYLMPAYWFITSVAAYIALYQLIVKPHYWEKTTHGLHLKKRGFEETRTLLRRASAVLGNAIAYANPLRLPRYAFSLVGTATKHVGSSESIQDLDIEVINPPINKEKSLKRWFRAQMNIIERYLPASLSLETLSKSGVLVVGIMVANVMNLLFNMYLGRALTFEVFGLVTFINTVWLVLVIFYNPIVNTVDHVTSVAFSEGLSGRASLFLFRMLRKALRYAFFLTLVWLLILPFIGDFFLVTDMWALISFTPLILFGIIDAVGRGYIRGSLRFHLLAMLMLLESSTKIITAIILVSLGYGDNVYFAIPAGIILSALVVLWLLRTENGFTSQTIVTTFPKKFYTASMLAGVSALLFLSVDILFVKHYLTPAAAGEYALLSLVGKMMFFLAAFPTSFMITFVSREQGLKNSTRGIFKLLFGTTTVLALVGFIVIGLFGDELIPLLFGVKARAILPYMTIYVAGIALFTLTNSIVTYHLAMKEYIYSILSIGFSAVVAVGIVLYHGSIGEIVTVIVATSILGFLTVSFIHFFSAYSSAIQKNILNIFTFKDQMSIPGAPITNKKRILIFNWRDRKHLYAGGAEIYVHEMAKRWVKEGYEVTLFCGNDDKNLRYETVDGIRVIRRGGFYLVYLWAPIYYLFVLKRKFDIVIDCQNGIPFFTPLYRFKKTYCLMHHVHQEVFTKSLHPILAWVARFLEKRVMPIVYRNIQFITVSESSKKGIKKFGLGKKGITVIHPGVDLDTLTPGEKAKDPIIAYVGRLKEYKSIDVLIQAFQKVITKFPSAKLMIAGSGEEEAHLRDLARSLGLTSSVHFLGKISDIAKRDLLQKAWVSVNPSFMEGWGITTIESNACGTPVVASLVPGLQDSVKNPHTGYLVAYGDSDAFAEKITVILENKPLRDSMGAEALLWARYFSWDMTSNQFLQKIDGAKRYV